MSLIIRSRLLLAMIKLAVDNTSKDEAEREKHLLFDILDL